MTQTGQARAASAMDEEAEAHIWQRLSGIYQIRNRHTGQVYIGEKQRHPK